MPSATSNSCSTVPRKDKARLLKYLSNKDNFTSNKNMNDKHKHFRLRLFLPIIILSMTNFSKGGIQIQLYLGGFGLLHGEQGRAGLC